MNLFDDIAANGWGLAQGDACEKLRALPDACVDMIATDPPYESLEKHRAVGSTTRLTHSKKSSNDWFTVFPNKRFPELFHQLYRVLKKGSHCYVWCDDETSDVMKPLADKAGFKVWKRLVWDKQVIGMGYHYRARYEFILFLEKGKRRLTDLAMPDILQHRRLTGKDVYPAEKPVSLYGDLIRQSTNEGDLVCDPFMGSGAGGVAALHLKRKFLGFDLKPEAVALAKSRLVGVDAFRR